jgi:hypothetical protein
MEVKNNSLTALFFLFLFFFFEGILVSHGSLWGPGLGVAVGKSGPAWETKNWSCLEHFGGISPSPSFPNVG